MENDFVTDEEKAQIDKYLMRAFNELCKIEKLLKQKGEKNNE